MMKKVLSVALSVIMVLSLIAVPGFAADPAASVEYTVSNVTYAGQVYDELNPAADSDGYVMAEGINFVPDNGKKLVPSVNVSASEASTATVIFAVYTDGVLTNAFYETKAVGTDAVTFSKEITVADKERETYRVFVLDANGNTIAPVSSFPIALNALEYMEITYADGTSDKHFGEDLASDTIVANISDARKVANPSIQVVPADNTTVVSIDIGANFWNDGATIQLKALDGEVITYNVISDLVKVGFTATLDNKFRFGGTALKKEAIVPTKQYASFEAGQEIVNVTVPYGAASVTVDPIIIYENGVQKKSATEEVSMDGAAVKEYTIGVGSKEYKFVFAWDDSAPYVSEVKFDHAYPKRSIVVRADGASAVGYTSSASDISATTATVTTSNALANAGEADSLLTVNGTAIPNNSNLTVFAIAREDNFTRSDMINYDQPKWVHMTETEAWTSFKVSAAATVYVKMSHANAAEADFVWNEGAAAGWTKASSSNQGTIYYKTFAAGETVNVPSQTVTEAELAFVNAKLATAYPATATEVGSVQFQYQLADVGAQLYYKELTAAGWSEWTAHPKGKNAANDGAKLQLGGKYHRGMYFRNSADHNLSIGKYGSDTFVAVAFDNVPAGGEDPDQPGEGGGDEPVVPPTPTVPTLEWESAIALTENPKTQNQGPANRRSLHKDGLYRVGAVSGSVELNPEETTVNLTVPYGVEVVKMGDVSVNLLDDADHAATATVTVAEVEYTVNVSWAAYAYDAENAEMPMLYDLEYTATGRTGLYDTDWYYAIPTNLVLDADHDYVVGESDLKGMKADGSGLAVNKPAGTWFTRQSHDNVNLSSTNMGNQVNRLHLAPMAFESWVTAGYLETKYDLNGATSIIANYTDVIENNAVRYKFKAGVDGYVIVASRAANTALTAEDGWAQLTGATMKFTNASTTAQGETLNNPPEGHTNVVKNYAEWSGDCNFIYAKKVSVGEVVEVAESTVTSNYPPIVIVATEDMITLDIADTEDPVDPNPGEPDNSANELVLSYTTALAVTNPKSTENHINGKNRVDGKTSIYAGGLYMPTLVETAANAVVDHEAKTAVVTVPFGTEIVNLVAATGAEVAIDLADNASIVMLNDNGAEKTFNVVAGESTYAVTVKWADASDANIGAASTGADVYGLQFAKADLWTEGQNATYGIVPTKIDLSYEVSVDASKYEEGQVPTSLRKGVYYAGGNTTVFAGNMTAKNISSGNLASFATLARYKLFTGSFTPWVEAGIIASENDLDNATIVNTGEHYMDAVYTGASSNAPADGARYAFNVEAAGVVYVIADKSFTNDGTWTQVNIETWIVTRGGSNPNYIFAIGALDDALYVKNVAAGEKVTIKCAGASQQPPVVIYDAGATFVAPQTATFTGATYKIGDGEATAIDFGEGTTATIEVPWGTDADISVAAVISNEEFGSVAVGNAINLATAEDNTGSIKITFKPLVGANKTYTVTFAWGEKPADPEQPGEEGGETPVEPTALGDIEDAGVAADTDASLGATQDAASADVTIEGNAGAEARGQHVVVFVLADGMTLADVTTALSGSGDLVAEGIVLGMGSATVDANGDYAVDMTLPGSVTSGAYDVAVITGEDAENVEDALVFVAISEKVAAYNAIVTGAADPFADVELIISTGDIYADLSPSGKAAVEASVLAKDAVDALPEITEPTPGEFVGLENIATLGAIIDTRIAAEALNDGADAAELALLWNYLFPAADAESDDIVAVAGAIYKDATALNATGKAKVVAAIAEQDYETKTVGGAQVSVKTQVQADFAEAAFVELINNTGYSNINSVAALVDTYIEAGVFEDLTGVSTTTLSTIVRDHTISSYATFEALVESLTGGSDTPTTGGTEVVVPGTNAGTTTGGMSSSNKPAVDPKPVVPTPAKKQLADFTDAGDAAWAATALQMMLDREILGGYEDGTIRPNNNATRQEVAKMLVEAFSEVRAGAWTGFADVPAGSWYYSYVATAAEDGIIKGVSATDFGTDAMITREDLSVLIYRFLVNKGITLDTNANKVFTDATSISDYAADAINALSNAGVINGYEDGSFNPKGNATRAEIAQVIANVLVLFAL